MNRKKTAYCWIIGTSLLMTQMSCGNNPSSQFTRIREDFTNQYFNILPEEAPPSIQSQNGNFGRIFIPSEANLKQLETFYRKNREPLQDIDFHELNEQQQLEYQKMVSILRNVYTYLLGFRNRPQYYNVQTSIYKSFSKQLSTAQQAESLILKLDQMPAYYEAARANLVVSGTADAQNAIEQNIKTYQLLEKEVAIFLSQSGALNSEVENSLYYAKIAVKDYIAYCRSLEYEAKTMQANFKE